MKKFAILFGIIASTLVSCSTDDDVQKEYNQKSNKTVLIEESDPDFCATCRDSISRDNSNDTIVIIAIDPVKPDRPKN